MSMPFYVAPEQVMKDRETYARKGIARGRSLIAARSADGIVLVAENRSSTLRKISEIYDRIAFAGVGRYNEFDQLRVAGVRHADMKGFSYSREDVDARSLANAYAQALGQVFTHEMKPLEVEILVAEVGRDTADDQLFHIRFDGVVIDNADRAVLGGEAEAILERFEADHDPTAPASEVLAVAIAALAGPDRSLSAEALEAALLDRAGPRRTFRRLTEDELTAALPVEPPEESAPDGDAESDKDAEADNHAEAGNADNDNDSKAEATADELSDDEGDADDGMDEADLIDLDDIDEVLETDDDA